MSQSNLFSKIKIKKTTFRNRIILSPMCQYKADHGFITDWHIQHYSRFAFSGLGGAFMEATAIAKDGRITHGCTGIWRDQHIDGLKKITQIFKGFGCMSGIQLAHSGRKGSCLRPWDGATSIQKNNTSEDLWTTYAPSAIPTNEDSQTPKELTRSEIEKIITYFCDATHRAKDAGFDMIEIHGAHGYLLHSFFSPLSNHRQDSYGGNIKNRMYFSLEIVKAVRKIWPDEKPLFYRISSTDNVKGGITINDNINLVKELKNLGVDVIDCSSGGISGSPTLATSRIVPGFQVPYAETIKEETHIKTMAVGAIIDADQAEAIITKGRADFVALGRELLADPQWTYKAAKKLKPQTALSYLPKSYSFYLSRRDKLLDRSADPA
ncbi:MAG: NADH:flavin oxidoreductase/NADH oxidase [Paracoccaceae bacterium]|nr:NADH:flavin oxidoreductase/NADH oxidase [Paracoccaceae bacterium]